MRRMVLAMLRVAGCVYGGMLVLLVGCQSSMMYFPRRESEDRMFREAQEAGLEPWRPNGDAVGWRSATASAGSNRVLVFHGNAGCASDRNYYVQALEARPGGCGWDPHIFEYPGYGARPGRPSEKVFRKAAREALDALLLECSDPVWLIGESLGSGVACRLAADRPEAVAGVLLITPFTSFVDVGRVHYPWLPVRWLLRDRYDSAAALRSYTGPVVAVLAERDEVVPASLGQALFDGYAGPKLLFVQPGRTHNTVDLHAGASWWKDAMRFLLSPRQGRHALQDGP